MSNVKYSNTVFYIKLYEALRDGTISQKTAREAIERKYNIIRRRKAGYWKVPEGDLAFQKALEDAKHILEQDAGDLALMQCLDETARFKRYHGVKCKIVFFLQEELVFPGVEHLCRAALSDPRFDTKLVYVPFAHENNTREDTSEAAYRAMGLPIINCADYDLSEDNPEIAVFVKPYNQIPPQFYIAEVEKVVKRTIYIPYGLELTKQLIKYAFQDYTHYRVWRHLGYGEVVKEMGKQYGYRDGENIAVWGHPRVDNYLVEQNRPVPAAWSEKIKGRKVILWCPHHTIGDGPECVSTWLDYYTDIFRLFEERDDLVMLWRPHPLLFGAIVNHGFMTKEELDAFIAEKTAQNNVILDQTGDYRTAFAVSDAIITDGTTFSFEYLLTGKPLMLTAHKLDQFYHWQEFGDAVYWAQNVDDIEAFLKNVSGGVDPRREMRERFKRKMFSIPESGTVSQHILDRILIELTEEEIELISGA